MVIDTFCIEDLMFFCQFLFKACKYFTQKRLVIVARDLME